MSQHCGAARGLSGSRRPEPLRHRVIRRPWHCLCCPGPFGLRSDSTSACSAPYLNPQHRVNWLNETAAAARDTPPASLQVRIDFAGCVRHPSRHSRTRQQNMGPPLVQAHPQVQLFDTSTSHARVFPHTARLPTVSHSEDPRASGVRGRGGEGRAATDLGVQREMDGRWWRLNSRWRLQRWSDRRAGCSQGHPWTPSPRQPTPSPLVPRCAHSVVTFRLSNSHRRTHPFEALQQPRQPRDRATQPSTGETDTRGGRGHGGQGHCGFVGSAQSVCSDNPVGRDPPQFTATIR